MIGRLGLTLLTLLALAASSSASAARHDPRDPQKRHNAADQAWAKRMRIQRTDLGAGDWRVEPGTSDDRGAPKECRNPDISDLVETGSSDNPDFSRNGSFVGSGAIVFLNEQQASKAWALVARQPLTRCLVGAFEKGLAGSGVRLKILSDGPIAMPKLAPHFKAGRIRLEISGPAATIKGRLSFYLLARGRASVLLMVMSFDRPMQPISLSLERHLATLVARRLER